MMKTWKLKDRLILSYSSILIMMLLGITSLICVTMMASISTRYSTETVPVVEQIGLTRRNIVSVRRYLLNAIIAETPEDFARVEESMNADRNALYASLDAIEQLNGSYTETIEQVRNTLESVANYNN